MAIEMKQGLKQGQHLLITPQLQQAIKLLQLSRVELQEFVQQQLSENPVLEESQLQSNEERTLLEKERETTPKDIETSTLDQASNLLDKKEGGDASSEIDWDKYTKGKDYEVHGTGSRAGSEEYPNYENIVTHKVTLHEYLFQQLSDYDLSEREKQIATAIIGNIDEKGYLDQNWEETVRAVPQFLEGGSGEPSEEIEDMLDLVQRLDPPGVAARDLKECLLNQLRQYGLKNEIVEAMIVNEFKLLETRNFQQLSKALGVPFEEVLKNAQLIAELEPNPGRPFLSESTQYIIPDVYVFKLGSDWMVSLNDEGLPSLRISQEYQEVLDKSKAGSTDREYLSERLKSAEWLIKSLQQRKRTIFRVAEVIVKRQEEFFEKGVAYLRPMILKDIANELTLHESTISRVTSNKYVHTPRGIFELKYFFNSSLPRSDGGEGFASESVKQMIVELVKNEDPKKPLSDTQIVETLDKKGLQIARRTVAKYREQLNILPSSKRKKIY